MNALVPLEKAAADLVALLDKHDATLRPGIYGNDREVNGYTKLVPETDARTLLPALEAAQRPAGFAEAKACAALLLGSYPARPVNDVKGFTAAITEVFHDYPCDVGKAAVKKIRRRLKFPLTPADVEEDCRELVKDRRWALWKVKEHLAEHRRRREEAAEPKVETASAEEVAAILKKSGRAPAGPKEPFQPPAEPRGMSPDQLESAGMNPADLAAFWGGRMGVGAEETAAPPDRAEEPIEGAEETTERAEEPTERAEAG